MRGREMMAEAFCFAAIETSDEVFSPMVTPFWAHGARWGLLLAEMEPEIARLVRANMETYVARVMGETPEAFERQGREQIKDLVTWTRAMMRAAGVEE